MTPDPRTTPCDSLVATLRAACWDRGAHEFVRVAGERFTYAEALEMVETTARGLRELGVEPGDRVGLMCQNRPETLWTWLGADAAGAIDVPFNCEVRGRLLAYLVGDAEPRVLVGTEDYLTILAETIEHHPEVVVCIGESTSRPFGDRARQIAFDELLALGAASTGTLEEPRHGDTATIMYTSGTTGPSKGVMLPQRYYPAKAAQSLMLSELRSDETSYCAQPLFHIDARAYVAAAIQTGSTVALGTRFSVSRFWDEIRANDAAVFGTIGTMLWMLHKQPPRPDDGDQPARMAICSSTPAEILRDFEARFDIEISEAYGMTESVLITASRPGETVPGRIGRPIPDLDVRIVDDDDAPVAAGTIGELIFRPKDAFSVMQGYWRKPVETVEAWRNLWFHSGDLIREDPDGRFEYIGRKKDSIRRRGENVSAWEVEQAVTAHPDVLAAAAIGVAAEVGEEDVAILVELGPGSSPDPVELIEFVSTDLPRFAVPRYVEFVERLPRTPSERIEKGKVRERGITEAAWDAEAAT
ncbi:MAG TPA: AMP-binding protein [Solirubrobacterales bacterium]|nr:AMP-binding protein [Solirubrobacterales bacterium]